MEGVLDEYARLCVLAYFWPYFVLGNADNIKEINRLQQRLLFPA
jgi:hypothetical protein